LVSPKKNTIASPTSTVNRTRLKSSHRLARRSTPGRWSPKRPCR
jgi:hypothetical protein